VHCVTKLRKQIKATSPFVRIRIIDRDLVEESVDRRPEARQRRHRPGEILGSNGRPRRRFRSRQRIHQSSLGRLALVGGGLGVLILMERRRRSKK